jgi:hypothetical protein
MSERNATTTPGKRKSGWKQWTPTEAQRALAAWRKSGLPLATFARERGIGAQRLHWWQKRLEGVVLPSAAKPRQQQSSSFVPAVITAPLLSLGPAAVSVRLPGGGVLEIADVRAVPSEWVGSLLAAAARASR